jgi:hypothetical protein
MEVMGIAPRRLGFRPPRRHIHPMTDTKPAEPATPPVPAPAAAPAEPKPRPREIGGPKGPEPTRYGDWEVGGRCSDF